MNEYEAKQERRRERLLAAAQRRREAAAAKFKAANDATAGIPPGQPILVDHHSAPRHRAALRRADRAMSKGVELLDEAKELAFRAAGVGKGGVSSDDPDAIIKLHEKLGELEAERDAMKRVNAYWRKNQTLEGCPEGSEVIAEALGNMKIWYGVHKVPFPSYAIANIGARIRQVKQRIEQVVEQAAKSREPVVEEVGGAFVRDEPGENRVIVTFGHRLSKPAYQVVRSYGFVWSPSRCAFVRKSGRGVFERARLMVESVQRLEADNGGR